jgi:hypothetical protein
MKDESDCVVAAGRSTPDAAQAPCDRFERATASVIWVNGRRYELEQAAFSQAALHMFRRANIRRSHKLRIALWQN